MAARSLVEKLSAYTGVSVEEVLLRAVRHFIKTGARCASNEVDVIYRMCGDTYRLASFYVGDIQCIAPNFLFWRELYDLHHAKHPEYISSDIIMNAMTKRVADAEWSPENIMKVFPTYWADAIYGVNIGSDLNACILYESDRLIDPINNTLDKALAVVPITVIRAYAQHIESTQGFVAIKHADNLNILPTDRASIISIDRKYVISYCGLGLRYCATIHMPIQSFSHNLARCVLSKFANNGIDCGTWTLSDAEYGHFLAIMNVLRVRQRSIRR